MALLGAGRPPAVRPEDAAIGPGSDWIMLPFIRANPEGTRFTDGTFGAYYAGHALETAVLEAKFHHARFLARTPPPRGARPGTLVGGRLLLADVEGALIDLRGRASELPQYYAPDPAQYGAPQRWAHRVRSDGANGVVYDSVRHRAGECVAVFRPRLISNCRESHQIAYEWDGTTISNMHVMQPLEFDR
jgi:RES domain-containing protein